MNIVLMSKVTRVLASALFAVMLVALPASVGAQTADGFCLSSSDLTTDLTVGSSGEDVIDLQIALLKDGQKTVTSGYFGTQTQAAVVAFQTKYGISPAAGYVGPLTRTKLTELYGCADSTTPRGTLMATVEGTSVFASDGGTVTVPPTTSPYTGTLLSIAWSGKNVTACSVNNVGGQFFGGSGVTGSKTWGPKQSTTLQLRCFTDPDGDAVLTKTVTVAIGSATPSTTDGSGTIEPVRIASTSPLPVATAGTPYSYTFTSTGGSGTRTWRISSGSLPAGLFLGSPLSPSLSMSCTDATCVLSGTPTAAGSNTFTLRLDTGDGQSIGKSFSLTVGAGSTSGDPQSGATGSIGFVKDGTLVSEISVTSGSPVTVNWSSSNAGTCAVYGHAPGSNVNFFYASGPSGSQSYTPTRSTTVFDLKCYKDSALTLEKQVTVTMTTTSALRITSTSPLQTAVVGNAYAVSLASTGGTGTRSWRISSGSLPPGLTLNATNITNTCPTGAECTSISGTPTAAGTYRFTAQVQTSGGQSTSKEFTITVVEPTSTSQTPQGSISLTAAGVTGRSVSVASGSTVSISWNATNVDSCAVYGRAEGSTTYRFYRTGKTGTNETDTPTRTTTYSLECFKNGTQVLDEEATATVTTTSALRITSTSPLPAANANTPYSYTFTSTGGSGTRTWSTSGTLPPGLSLNTSACANTTNCVLSGTPTTVGPYSFTVRLATGDGQSIGKSFSITVGSGPASLVFGEVGVSAGSARSASSGSTPSSISVEPGTQVSVYWTASGVDACAVYGGTNFYATGLSNSKTDAPTRATTYRLECFKGGVQVVSKSVGVNILASAEVMGTLDYNNDHKLDQIDAQFLADVAAGTRSCPSGKICDVNKDSRISSSDSLALWRYIGTSSTSGLYDYNNDLKIDSLDVARLYGVVAGTAGCPTGKVCNIDGAGSVDAADVSILKGYIGSPAVSGSVLGANTGSSVCYIPATRDLSIGSTGPDVTNLQQVLTRDGENVPSTGYFGKQTQSAVIKFQQKYGIVPASGYVGPLTRAKLAELYDC
jgi:peptidoglycan hydrolase-like protein with peptidoglycan-binding domain